MGENSETVLRVYDAMNRGDIVDFISHIDREIRWRAASDAPDAESTYVGHTGASRFLDTRLDAWAELIQEPTALREDGDVVVALVRVRGRGRASGIELEEESAHLWRLREGRVVLFETFADEAEALAAAGIAPHS